ncbi:hypothetical protein L211DRAFT_640296 [Terfezia boudieri ATCC MYA-4762]|uniref:Uncharacterized protein n=1 Tax=Terfezia boudieri ATCC MYA-4762 TaxID=1051890 RepID=A0A3N4L8R9_9PEZI|nr:hypothetical protein L211DRAFT_640296 [Terfezia boudieri ATCC MYA-4762]
MSLSIFYEEIMIDILPLIYAARLYLGDRLTSCGGYTYTSYKAVLQLRRNILFGQVYWKVELLDTHIDATGDLPLIYAASGTQLWELKSIPGWFFYSLAYGSSMMVRVLLRKPALQHYQYY